MLFWFTKLIQVSVLLLAITFVNPSKNNKSKPPYQITQIAEDGGWLWFNNESILINRNTIYIGSEDSKGNSKISLYRINNDLANKLSTDYKLSTWEEKASRYPYHNYPSLLKLSNGNVLAVYHHSSKEMFYRIGEVINKGKAEEALRWGDERIFNLNNGMNYSNLIQLSKGKNKVYNFFSVYTNSPSIMSSEDGGKSWSQDTVFMMQGKGGTTPYSKFSDNGKDRVDMLYTNGHPRKEADNNIFHIYFHNGNLYKSDGTVICSLSQAKQKPISPEAGTKIYDGKGQNPGWVWDIEYDRQGLPVAVFISSEDGAKGNDLRYHYAQWNPEQKQWIERQIAYAGSHQYTPENHFAGGICIDPENVNVVFISSNVNPETGRESVFKRYQIYRGITKDNGINWQWEQVTFDKNTDNFRPIVPRGHDYKTCVIWYNTHGSPYKTGFDSKILGIFNKYK